MSRSEEIAKIDRTLRDSEARLKGVDFTIISLDKDIANFEKREKMLEANIKILKQNQIIAVAEEYKKAKEELKLLHIKLMLARSERDHFLKIKSETEASLQLAQKKLERLKNDIILNFPGKKNG